MTSPKARTIDYYHFVMALEQKETERVSQSQNVDKGICIKHNIHTTHVDM